MYPHVVGLCSGNQTCGQAETKVCTPPLPPQLNFQLLTLWGGVSNNSGSNRRGIHFHQRTARSAKCPNQGNPLSPPEDLRSCKARQLPKLSFSLPFCTRHGKHNGSIILKKESIVQIYIASRYSPLCFPFQEYIAPSNIHYVKAQFLRRGA